jgi:hypothetical protein
MKVGSLEKPEQFVVVDDHTSERCRGLSCASATGAG